MAKKQVPRNDGPAPRKGQGAIEYPEEMRRDYERVEEIITDSQSHWYTNGQALQDMLDRRLWVVSGVSSFTVWCERFGITSRRAYQLMASTRAFTEIKSHHTSLRNPLKLPWNESHLVALMESVEGSERQYHVWCRALADCGSKLLHQLSAKKIRELAEEMYPPKPITSATVTSAPATLAEPVTEPVAAEPVSAEPESTDHTAEAVAVESEHADQQRISTTETKNTAAEDRLIAAEREREPTGGVNFAPEQWDEETEVVDVDGVHPHLANPMFVAKRGRAALREMRALYRKIEDLSNELGGSWIASKINDFKRHFEQMELDLKGCLYASNCPGCRNVVTTRCVKCGGRGFLDVAHRGQVSDIDKAWIKLDEEQQQRAKELAKLKKQKTDHKPPNPEPVGAEP